MPGRHQHKIFASPFGAATPNAIYTHQRAKPACPEDVNSKFSHLLLAQLPRTQFTHISAPNPHYWHSYPERNLQTAMPHPHARKTSTQNFRISNWRNCLEHSNAPNPHASKTSTQNLSPIGTAIPNTIYTQQRAKPACQEDINTNFRISYWHSYPERNLHSNAPNPNHLFWFHLLPDFFFPRLPSGQYDPVSQLSWSEKSCTGPFNWSEAHCAGENVKRRTGPFQRKSLTNQTRTTTQQRGAVRHGN